MPDEQPRVSDDVPAGFTVVIRAALFIPNIEAMRSFSSFAAFTADFTSNLVILPDPIPVIPTPSNASFSVVLCHTGRK
jgi:hypothetical protein